MTLVIVTDEAGHYDALRAAPGGPRAPLPRPGGDRAGPGAEPPAGRRGPVPRRGRAGADRGPAAARPSWRPRGVRALPLLLPDAPVVAWWPGAGPRSPAKDPVGALAQRRITDAAAADARRGLAALAAGYRPGRHRPGLDPDHPRGVRCSLPPWTSRTAVTGGSVASEPRSPSADLLAAWLAAARGADHPGGLRRARHHRGPAARDRRRHRGRPAGRAGRAPRRPGQPDRQVALQRRDTAEIIAEELRRLDPDDVYGETLARFAVGIGRGSAIAAPPRSSSTATKSCSRRRSPPGW